MVATPDDASGLGLLLVPDLVDAGRSRGEESSSDKDLHHLDKVSLGLCDFTPPVCMIHQFIIGIKNDESEQEGWCDFGAVFLIVPTPTVWASLASLQLSTPLRGTPAPRFPPLPPLPCLTLFDQVERATASSSRLLTLPLTIRR